MSDRPEDVDAAFAAIVADLEREGLGANLEADTEPTEDLPHPQPPSAQAAAPAAAAEPATPTWRTSDAEWDWTWSSDDEHYVPPEPPPLPRLRPMTIVAILLIVVGVVLLLAPNLIGLYYPLSTTLSLLSLVSGFALLFLRIRRTPSDSGDDNGAQV